MYQTLQTLPRWAKTTLFAVSDAVLIVLFLFVAFWMRWGSFEPGYFLERSGPLFALAPGLGVGLFWVTGLYRVKLSAFDGRSIPRIAWLSLGLVLMAYTVSYVFALLTPRSVPLIFGLLCFLGVVGIRLAARRALEMLQGRSTKRENVLVYGAGVAGVQLVTALHRGGEMRAVAFIDDNPSLQGLVVSGLGVHDPAALPRLITRHRIEQVLLAIPSLPRDRQAELGARLDAMGVKVKFLPSFGDMIASGSLVDSLQSFSPDDLLGRNAVDPGTPEVARTYCGASVMVTGAGGSIGSELCRQILKCRPKRLVLFEMSEFALYAIEKELRGQRDAELVEIVPRLGSVCDRARMDRVIGEAEVEVIVHAAAYKHVPMVEDNPTEGARNNILGTLTAAQAARDAGVSRFVLVSTDKAVRPTSVMGATKRMAEIAVQDLQDRSPETKFALVRFGNVLGSSGSVIPLFNEQIRSGGPVTLTDARVTRYFMTISEAAGLVLLAGAFASGGDVFVLDMGQPVAIRDLAERMIRMSGKTLKDADHPHGDIEIREIGLRPGEKLYEELLIDEDMLPTPHEKILRAQEDYPTELEVRRVIAALERHIAAGEDLEVQEVLAELVTGYPGPSRIIPIKAAE